MDKFLSYLVVAAIALIAVALAYRVRILHSIVFGRGSSMLNHQAEVAASAPGVK